MCQGRLLRAMTRCWVWSRNGKVRRRLSVFLSGPNGGRTWWAHFEFTRIKHTPTILPKKIEDLREAGASTFAEADLSLNAEHR
jgi:hypothetical protein